MHQFLTKLKMTYLKDLTYLDSPIWGKQGFYHFILSLMHIYRKRYLIAGNKVFPLALALLCTSMVTLFLHSVRYHFPQLLVPLSLHESLIQLCTDHKKLFCFLDAPLGKPISHIHVDTTHTLRKNPLFLLLLLMQMTKMMSTLHSNRRKVCDLIESKASSRKKKN